jgi:chemotaxis protein methyltransferase CheR
VGRFQFIFLRNVMIYFSDRTKAEVVSRLLHQLEPGGCLIVGRSETLHGLGLGLSTVETSIYRKPDERRPEERRPDARRPDERSPDECKADVGGVA